MTSLAAQLSAVRSLNASRLASSAALTSQVSYLFPADTAATQDIATVHALGVNGWSALCAQDAALARWEGGEMLFGETSKELDRVTRGKEENEQIDRLVAAWLAKVGAVLLGKPAAKCLEWLVRRFRWVASDGPSYTFV